MMSNSKQPANYILSNASKTLNIGVTSSIEWRINQHKRKIYPGFAQQYNLTKLVYFELSPSMAEAIETEKQLKGWVRLKKIALIDELNPDWIDLSSEIIGEDPSTSLSMTDE